jgi:hypothetical protein
MVVDNQHFKKLTINSIIVYYSKSDVRFLKNECFHSYKLTIHHKEGITFIKYELFIGRNTEIQIAKPHRYIQNPNLYYY